jgi:hypothetical protein
VALARKPNESFNADANTGHRFASSIVGALRLRLRRRLTRALGFLRTSMDHGFLILIVLAAVFSIRSAIKNTRIPATSADWYVVFDIEAEKKVLSLWFYPVIAFEQKNNQTIAITTRPDYTSKLSTSRPAKKVADSMWGVSVSYGRWFRDGVPFDEFGNPDLQGGSDFSAAIENHLLGEYKLHLATPAPVFYQEQIKVAMERLKNES